MAHTYILIDFENVQPSSLARFEHGQERVFLFVGPRQNKLSIQLSRDIHSLGDRATYIQAQSGGKNALDFFICFHAGQLYATYPKAKIYVISKDSGFDPLIQQLVKEGVIIERLPDLREIRTSSRNVRRRPGGRASQGQGPTASQGSKGISRFVERAKTNLIKRGEARPKTQDKLEKTLDSLFKDSISRQQRSAIIKKLQDDGIILVHFGKVSYPDLEVSPLTLVGRG